jgi:hypothetical protein
MIEQTGIRTRSGEILALKDVGVCSRIAGLLARTTVQQRYRNDTGANLEVAYTFPLPVDAVLLDFSVRIGERIHQGEVVARRQAEDQYEQAVETGHSAFRLQALDRGVYGATLGNVLFGETVELQLAYAEPQSWNGRSLRFRLPTTLAPRYGEPIGLIGFGSRFVAFDPALRTADRSTVDAVQQFVADLPAMGGTELESALEAALVHASDASPLDILLLTDGEAWKLGDVIAKAKTIGARIFTLGIGSAVAEDTVRRLADETGGACELVAPNEEDARRRLGRHRDRR